MGQVNRGSLQDFLSGQIQDRDLVIRLMGLLEPFFRQAESCVYQLAPEAELDSEQVRAAIAQTTGQEVTRIVFVSRGCLGDDLWVSLGDDLWDSLQASLHASFHASLRANLGASLWTSLTDSLWTSLTDSLRASLQASLWDSLLYLLGFAIAGKTEMVEQLVPLIELLPKAIPLGVKRDEPGVWVVLTA